MSDPVQSIDSNDDGVIVNPAAVEPRDENPVEDRGDEANDLRTAEEQALIQQTLDAPEAD